MNQTCAPGMTETIVGDVFDQGRAALIVFGVRRRWRCRSIELMSVPDTCADEQPLRLIAKSKRCLTMKTLVGGPPGRTGIATECTIAQQVGGIRGSDGHDAPNRRTAVKR